MSAVKNKEPKWEDLKVSVDKLFLQVDKHKTTVKDAFKALEAEHDATLSKPTKKRVRSHLVDLVYGTVRPEIEALSKRLRTAPSVDFLLEKPEILMVLVKSRYLTDKEMARLFLMTAKAATNHALLNGTVTDDWVWKELCLRKWGPTSTANKLRHTGWTHKKFYRKFALEIDDKKDNKLKYSPEDYTLIVDLRGRDMDVCQTIPGNQIKGFFKNGTAKVKYETPIWEGEYDEWSEECMEFCPVVSILQRPDDKLVEIGRSSLYLALDFKGNKVDVEIADFDTDLCDESRLVLRKPVPRHGGRETRTYIRVDVLPICKQINSETFGIFGLDLQGVFVSCNDWDYAVEDAGDFLRGDKNQFAHYLAGIEGFVPF